MFPSIPFFLILVLPSVVIFHTAAAADTLKGLVECMNHQECLGANRVCSHDERSLTGKCVCRQGYTLSEEGFSCVKTEPQSEHVTCQTDEDCDRNEVCMSWQYDPTLEYARKLRNKLSSRSDQPEKHQFCIDAWIIYNNHLEEMDEPRTGGGLKSGRRNFEAEDYFFSGRRPPRVQQQYIGFAEDLMLILFLVCILATLVTVHRGACYRQIQDARRNTPLRHILPIPEDRPPPYTTRHPESVDGLSSVVVCSNSEPKPLTESPPPSYEEALFRNTVRLTELEEQDSQNQQEEVVVGVTVTNQGHGENTEYVDESSSGPTDDIAEDITTEGEIASEISDTLGAQGGSEEDDSDNHILQSVKESMGVIDFESEAKADTMPGLDNVTENTEVKSNSEIADNIASDGIDNNKITDKNAEERERLIADVPTRESVKDDGDDVVNV